MSPSGVVGRILKRFLLRPRVQPMDWPQLCRGALVSGERFDQMIAGVGEAAAGVAAGGHMPIRDILAHLVVANVSIAARLDALRAGTPGAPSPPDLFAGAGDLSLTQLRQAHADSLRRIAEAAARPITSQAVAEHDFFGPMDAREWLALVAFHHEYHGRQVERIQRSAAYRQATGASW